jgi:hypothetical protein
MRHIISGAIICASMICKMLTAGYMGDHDETWELISLKKILIISPINKTDFSLLCAHSKQVITKSDYVCERQLDYQLGEWMTSCMLN